MNIPPNWQLIFGLPVLTDGDACVVAYQQTRRGSDEALAMLFVSGVFQSQILLESPFSPKHFAAAEKMLRDWQAENSIEEVHRSESVTVFRNKRTGETRGCMKGERNWFAHWNSKLFWADTRERAEAATRKSLMEQANG